MHTRLYSINLNALNFLSMLILFYSKLYSLPHSLQLWCLLAKISWHTLTLRNRSHKLYGGTMFTESVMRNYTASGHLPTSCTANLSMD